MKTDDDMYNVRWEYYKPYEATRTSERFGRTQRADPDRAGQQQQDMVGFGTAEDLGVVVVSWERGWGGTERYERVN